MQRFVKYLSAAFVTPMLYAWYLVRLERLSLLALRKPEHTICHQGWIRDPREQ